MLAYRMYVFDTAAFESHRCDPIQFGVSVWIFWLIPSNKKLLLMLAGQTRNQS